MQGAQSLSTPPKDSASPFNRTPSGPPSATPEATALSNPGNMYGLMVSACPRGVVQRIV